MGPLTALAGAPPGGLRTLFTMVLGGMAGESPHMVAASVMALARLLYEFGGALAASVPELMPAVLSLLRSRAREVVKAVLGFLKVLLRLIHCSQCCVHNSLQMCGLGSGDLSLFCSIVGQFTCCCMLVSHACISTTRLPRTARQLGKVMHTVTFCIAATPGCASCPCQPRGAAGCAARRRARPALVPTLTVSTHNML